MVLVKFGRCAGQTAAEVQPHPLVVAQRLTTFFESTNSVHGSDPRAVSARFAVDYGTNGQFLPDSEDGRVRVEG